MPACLLLACGALHEVDIQSLPELSAILPTTSNTNNTSNNDDNTQDKEQKATTTSLTMKVAKAIMGVTPKQLLLELPRPWP